MHLKVAVKLPLREQLPDMSEIRRLYSIVWRQYQENDGTSLEYCERRHGALHADWLADEDIFASKKLTTHSATGSTLDHAAYVQPVSIAAIIANLIRSLFGDTHRST